jgi:hypothetical protein
VQDKPSQELHRRQLLDFAAAKVGVILHPEPDPSLGDRHDPVIRDGPPGAVLPQIARQMTDLTFNQKKPIPMQGQRYMRKGNIFIFAMWLTLPSRSLCPAGAGCLGDQGGVTR